MIRIERADAGSIAAIMPVMNEAFDPAFGEAWTAAQCLSALALPGSQLLIARGDDGTAIGFALSRWVLDEEELLMIGVAPEQQRRNIATTLLEEVIDLARQAGRYRIFLEVRENNKAQLFYHKSGFEEIGRRRDYYRGNDNVLHDAITMALSI